MTRDRSCRSPGRDRSAIGRARRTRRAAGSSALAGLRRGCCSWPGGAALGRAVQKLARPDAAAVQEAAATTSAPSTWSSWRARATRDARATSSCCWRRSTARTTPSNPRPASARSAHDPRRVWMYLERVPLVAYGARRDRAGRLHRARVARRPRPDHRGADRLRRLAEDREGRALPGLRTTGETPEGRGHLRVRRRRLERAAHLARRLAEPQAADARGRELPQRAHGLVPRGDRLRARDDRHRRRSRATTGSPGTTSATARPRARRTAPPARPTRATSCCRRWPTCGTTRRADGSARSATRSGTWACSGTAGRTGRPTTSRSGLLRRARRPRLAAAQPRAVPAAGGLPPAGGARLAWRRTSRTRVRPRMGAVAPTYCCAPRSSGYQGDLLEATLANEPIGADGAVLLYTTFKSPDYTGHVYGMGSKWKG